MHMHTDGYCKRPTVSVHMGHSMTSTPSLHQQPPPHPHCCILFFFKPGCSYGFILLFYFYVTDKTLIVDIKKAYNLQSHER